ncbi:hypothetical protein FHR88_007098 [Bradyrhizobium betae]|nr:hypothetical protein [Bradyrhizobium betae]
MRISRCAAAEHENAARYRRAVDRLHLRPVHPEHLREPRHVPLGFLEVRQKALLQRRGGRLVRHFRQSLDELLLDAVRTGARHRRSRKARDPLRWNNAGDGRI